MINRAKLGFPTRLLLLALTWFSLLFANSLGHCLANDSESGSSKRQFRNEALQAIPFQQLNQPTREKISDILQSPSIYRRLPVTSIEADPDYFLFLVRHPEVVVNIWQLMGITRMTTDRTGPFTFDMNDGAGTISSLELLYGDENRHIFYGTGSYDGPFLRKKLTGRCVLILQTRFYRGPDGRPASANQLDVFLKVDNATIGLIAKSISPIVGSTADHNFVESLKFVQRLNSTTQRNGPGVQGMARRLNLDEKVESQFIDLAGVVYDRENERAFQRQAYPPSIAPVSRSLETNRLGEQRARVPLPSNQGLTYPTPQRSSRPAMPQSSLQQPSRVGHASYDGQVQSQPNHSYPAPVTGASNIYRPYGHQAPVYRNAQVPPIVRAHGYSAIQYPAAAGATIHR